LYRSIALISRRGQHGGLPARPQELTVFLDAGEDGGETTAGAIVLSHLSFGVADLAQAATFYDGALAALGYVRVWSNEDGVGYGVAGGNDRLALFPQESKPTPPGAGFHLAFQAPSRAAVDAFHAAALRLGGRDQGQPGARPHYSPTYYAAFVTDPDGHKLEAVHQ
jgi:catechol 2,3-dioxygenase-like lactoylglutathione lyase family enzyme